MNDRLLANCRPLLVGLVLWMAASMAAAEMGIVQKFPVPPKRMRNGLTVEVDTRGVASNGYRSIRVKLFNTPSSNKPPVPVTADRRIRVVLAPSGVGHMSRVTTSQVIEIPEKQASGEATIAIPTAGDWHQIQMNVYEGGDMLDDVSGAFASGLWGTGGDTESLPTLLFIDGDTPDRATRDNRLGIMATRPAAIADSFDLPDYSNVLANIPFASTGMGMGATIAITPTSGKRLSDAQILALTSQQTKVHLLPPAELPGRWIELSCYDIAFISLDDLAKMAKQNSRQRRALVDWLHGGPALVVYGVGDDFERLQELEQLLDLPPLPGAADPKDKLRGWVPGSSADSSRSTYPNAAQQVTYGPGGAMMATVNQVVGTPVTPPTTSPTWFDQKTVPFASRNAGLGYVTAITFSDPFPAEAVDWQSVLQSISPQHQLWNMRHGMSYKAYNQGLWNWYIPGVGAAPVFSFLLLATLFAVLIGPVNYLLLGKINRLYLLLVTVPIGAAVVTIGLFTYALLSDGLGVKARIRSFSLLDQKSGRNVSWSRQSYYASLVPSQGMIYPEDTVIWPLDERPLPHHWGPARQLVWEADGQRLRSGYLSSRRLTQFIVTRVARTKSRLSVAQKPGSPPQVTNELGGTIEQLVLCDDQGNYFQAEKPLAVGNSQSLTTLEKIKVQTLLSGIITENLPQFPEGYDPVAEMRRTESPWNRNIYWGSNSRVVLESGVLETNISALQRTATTIPGPGMYVAIMESNSDVPLGITKVTEGESFHVIVGRW